MKKGSLKKIFASCLAFIMVVTMVPTAYASTGETVSIVEIEETVETEAVEKTEETVEAEENVETEETVEAEAVLETEETVEVVEETEEVVADEYGTAVASVDITPPVVESYSFVENGQQVLRGDSIHIRFTGYDADQTPFSVEDTYISLTLDGSNTWYNLWARSITNISGNEYEITFEPFSVADVGTFKLEYLFLIDEAGNTQQVSLRDASGNYTNTFVLCEETNTEISVSNITLSESNIVLDDVVMQDSVTVTMDVTGTTEEVRLLYRAPNKYNNYDTYYAWASYNEANGKHQATISMGYSWTAGTYELFKVYYNDAVVTCNETSSFVLEKHNTDVTGPIIEAVELYYNGEKIAGGEILSKDGVLQVRAKVNDASGINYVSGNLYNVLTKQYEYISFNYDETLGCYVCNIALSELYATEWYVTTLWARDKYDNEGSYYFGSSDKNYENYFYVKDAQGNCQIPTYTYRVNFANSNISTEVTTGSITSIKEMFPNGVPITTEKEGLTFLGWQIYDKVVSETDKFMVYGSDMYLAPVYDKIEVTLNLQYFSETVQGSAFEMQTIYVEKGTTYGDLLKLVDDSVITHNSAYTFEGWKHYEYFESIKDQEILYYANIGLMADYKENPIQVMYAYIDEYGQYFNFYKMVEVKDGATYQDVLDASGLKDMKHYSGLKNTGWTCINTPDMSAKIDTLGCEFRAVYEENVLALHYNYVKDDLRNGVKREIVIYDESSEYYGMTYREAMEHFVKDVAHASELTFTGWYSYYDDYYLDSKISSGLSNIYATAQYKEPLVNVYVEYVGEDGEYTGDSYYVLAKEGVTYQQIYDSLTLDYTHGGEKTFDNWKVYLYDQNMTSEIGATGIYYMDIVALYKEKTDDTIYYPIVTPEVPVVESVKTETTTKTETSKAPVEEVEEVVETKPAVKLETKVIEEKVEEITLAEEGATFIVEMKKEDGTVATEIPVEILEAVKGKDVEITLDMGDYSWTINGKDVLASDLKAINLEVTLDTEAIAPSIVDALAGGEPTRQLSLTHNGDFGFKASLSINVGSEHEGEFGNLYYHDSYGKLVFMNAGQIDADGNVNLDFSHASDYVVVVGRDRTEEEAAAGNTDTDGQDNAADTTGVVEDTEGGNSFPVGIVVLVVVVAAVIAVAVMKNKKK